MLTDLHKFGKASSEILVMVFSLMFQQISEQQDDIWVIPKNIPIDYSI